jgi:hypothetical protein
MNGSSKVCKHAKNQKLFTSRGRKYIVIQVAHDVVRDDVKKVVRFVTMLQQGHPMLEYEVITLVGQWQSSCIKRF